MGRPLLCYTGGTAHRRRGEDPGMKIRPAAVLEEEGRLLLLHYRHPGGEVYGIPGGGVEPGESLRRTLVREMEEAGA